MVTAMDAVVKPQRIARAFPELRCTFGGRSTVPDISVFTWNRIPRSENDAMQTEVFDESEGQLPVPPFASELRLIVGELFGWLLE